MVASFSEPYALYKGKTCSIAMSYMAEAIANAEKHKSLFSPGVQKKLVPGEQGWNYLLNQGAFDVVKTKAQLGEFKQGAKVGSWLAEDGQLVDVIYAGPSTFSVEAGSSWVIRDSATKQILNVYDADHDMLIDFVQNGNWALKKKNGNLRWGVSQDAKKPAVSPFSTSTGAVTDEDMAALFVQTKDTLANELGLPIKGANPALDAKVYAKIAEKTGYKPEEAAAKVANYKASGKKLSALKKKVLKTSGPKEQPLPPPSQAAKEIKVEIKKDPIPVVYQDKSVAEEYIIAKDKVVAQSGGKWTLYSKSDALDQAILKEMHTQLPEITWAQVQTGLKNYIATGKKLSALKKDLIKNNLLKPEADTLKGGKKLADLKADPHTPKLKPDPAPEVPTPPLPKPEIPKPAASEPPAGVVPELTDQQLALVFKEIKIKGVFATSPPETVYNALESFLKLEKRGTGTIAKALADIRENDILTMVRAFDKAGAKNFGVPNTNLYEKKLTDWIQSGQGKQYILNKKKAEELLKNMPDLPPDSDLFRVIETHQARETQMNGSRLTGRHLEGVRTYTGGAYSEMNGWLRGKFSTISDGLRAKVNHAKEAMQVFDRDLLLHRGTDQSNFGVKTIQELYSLVGKTVQDDGFSSSSVGGRAAFGGSVTMVIQAPKGIARGLFVDDISLHKGEREMLLAPGTQYKVLRVEPKPSGVHGVVVHVRIVGIGRVKA